MTDAPTPTSSAPSGATVAVPRNEPAPGTTVVRVSVPSALERKAALPPTSAQIPPSGLAWISLSSWSFARTDLQANPLGVSPPVPTLPPGSVRVPHARPGELRATEEKPSPAGNVATTAAPAG